MAGDILISVPVNNGKRKADVSGVLKNQQGVGGRKLHRRKNIRCFMKEYKHTLFILYRARLASES